MQHDVWIIKLCALVVAGRAMQRYDTPETNRLTTTRNLFLFSAACYIMASVAVYAVLSEIVLKPGVLQILGVQDITNLLARYTAPPVLAAILLTTLLPQVPGLKAADGFMLERFQKLGRVPYGVSHLADQLILDRLGLTRSDLKASANWIKGEPDVPDDLIARLHIASPGTSEGLFSALPVLHRSVGALRAEPAYGRSFRKAVGSLGSAQGALRGVRRRYLAIGEEVRVATADFTARALTAVQPSGAAMVFAIALCLGLLKLPSATRDAAPVWWFPFALSFALGFVPGYIAPHLYRAARTEPQAAALMPQAVPAGA